MASAASEKEREFLRWKRRQDRSRAERAAAQHILQQQQQQQQTAEMMHRQPSAMRAYPAAFPQQQPARMSTHLYGDDGAADDSYVHAYTDSEPSPSRPFAETDDGADTEEDELMCMIMEKERQEAIKAATTQAAKSCGRGRKEQRLQLPFRTVRPTAVQVGDDFYSPVRPADFNGSSATEQHRGHAPSPWGLFLHGSSGDTSSYVLKADSRRRIHAGPEERLDLLRDRYEKAVRLEFSWYRY